MWLLIGILALIGAIFLVRFVGSFSAGTRLNDQLLSGNFDDSAVGKQLAAWFTDYPSREIQRQKFVRFAQLMGCPRSSIGERVLRCIMRVWEEPGIGFGAVLSDELGKLIVFDPPSDADQARKQKVAIVEIESFKNELRQLDQS